MTSQSVQTWFLRRRRLLLHNIKSIYFPSSIVIHKTALLLQEAGWLWSHRSTLTVKPSLVESPKPSLIESPRCACRAGQDHIYYIYGVCTVFLAGKSPNIRSYTAYIYGSGQPYAHALQVVRGVSAADTRLRGGDRHDDG